MIRFSRPDLSLSTQDPEPAPDLGFEIRFDGPVEALICVVAADDWSD